jgi:hypothetical protein
MYKFLHDSNTDRDIIINKIVKEFKVYGYSVYFKLEEFLTRNRDNFFMIFFEDDDLYKDIANALGGIRTSKVKEVIDRLAELNFIDHSLYKEGIVFSVKIIKEYKNYKQKYAESVHKLFEVCLESVRTLFVTRGSNLNFTMTYEKFLSEILRILSENGISISTSIGSSASLGSSDVICDVEQNDDFNSPESPLGELFVSPNETANKDVIPPPEKQTTEIIQAVQLAQLVDSEDVSASESPPYNNSKKKSYRLYNANRWEYKQAERFYKSMRQRDGTFPKPYKGFHEWADVFSWMLRDGRGKKEIEEVMEFIPQAHFWNCVIDNPEGFRKHFTKLKRLSQERPDLGKARYTRQDVQYAVTKFNRRWDDFERCVDNNGEEIYWDKTKGKSPYKEVEEDIVIYVHSTKGEGVMQWNITKDGTELPDGWYFRNIANGKKEYEKSGLKLKFFDNKFEFLEYQKEAC